MDQGVLRAKFSNRPYWRLRYTDGRVINEWERDWSHAPYRGRQAVRLCCPNGQVAELGTEGDCTGRLFQLKVAVTTMGDGHRTLAYLIGMVDGLNGECQYAAWRDSKLETGRDNVYQMRFENLGALSTDVLGLEAA